MKSNYAHTQLSVFDSLEHLQIASHSLLLKVDKRLTKPLTNIFLQWERLLNTLISEKSAKDQAYLVLKEKHCRIKNKVVKLRIQLSTHKNKEAEMIKEIQVINDHLEEGKEMWANQIKKIESSLQEQERSKQKIESLYQQRLSEIDSELDDIMHLHKNKLDFSQKIGNILPDLFSQEELREEEKIGLGEISKRNFQEFCLRKLENASGCDINSENSRPSMDLEDLNGTQKQVFQRLLALRKKVYKFKHDETTCSENTMNTELPSELKSISHINLTKICDKILSKTVDLRNFSQKQSDVMSELAGIIFGVVGSERYRAGLTKLIKSDKLSISEREDIVYNLINSGIHQPSLKELEKSKTDNKEDWAEMSSIKNETKEADFSQDLHLDFTKDALNKQIITEEPLEIEFFAPESKEEAFIKDLDEIFANTSMEFTNPAQHSKITPSSKQADPNQENSLLSILNDYSKNFSLSSEKKLHEHINEPLFIDPEESVIIHKKFSIEKREPNSFIVSPKANLFIVTEPDRPRSNPRVPKKSEESCRPRESSGECSSVRSKITHKLPSGYSKRPIPGFKKLPILPKPPSDAKRTVVRSFRGRSLQSAQKQITGVAHSPPSKKLSIDITKSTSPANGQKFRMRRFKEIKIVGFSNTKNTPKAKKINNSFN